MHIVLAFAQGELLRIRALLEQALNKGKHYLIFPSQTA